MDRFTIEVGIEVKSKRKRIIVAKSVFHFLSLTHTYRHVSSLIKSLAFFYTILGVIYNSFKIVVILYIRC